MDALVRFGTAAVKAIQAQRWLDTPGYKLEHGVALTFNLLGARGRALQDLLHGRWLGHPLHPIVVSLPLGAWTSAVVLDLAGVLSPRGEEAQQSAQLAVGLGVLGGFGAALTGITDWQHTQDGPRRSGLVHGLLNSAALSFNIISYVQRRRGRLKRARWIGAVGYVCVVAGGYLGGDLVYRDQIGVDHSRKISRPMGFVPVMAEADLAADTPHRVQCDGAEVVLIRHGNQITAVGEHCSHLGGPMSQGWVYRDRLVCPWHGSRFDLVTGCPATGPATAPLAQYETRLAAGQIEVRRVAERTATSIPHTRSEVRNEG